MPKAALGATSVGGPAAASSPKRSRDLKASDKSNSGAAALNKILGGNCGGRKAPNQFRC